MPWDLARTDPEAFTAAMPEGLMTVVASDAAGAGQDGYRGPNDAWVHVGADGAVTAFSGKVEGGQGTRTALALLVAEELGVPVGGGRGRDGRHRRRRPTTRAPSAAGPCRWPPRRCGPRPRPPAGC